jgi:hypothetical protein
VSEHATKVELDHRRGGWMARCDCGWEAKRPSWYKGRALGFAERTPNTPGAGGLAIRGAVAVTLPPAVAAEAQRILDGAACRLLAARLDRDAVGPASRAHYGAIDDGANQSAALIERHIAPVSSRNGDGRRGGGE